MQTPTNEEPVTFNLDGKTLAELVGICDREGKTPSAVIGGIIRGEAERRGLIFPPAKSA